MATPLATSKDGTISAFASLPPTAVPTFPFFDTVVIGAGAAGLFCAGQAGQRGLRVLLIDHADKVAEKFCRSALSRYTPADFIALLQKHGIPFHEKHKGQLFCDRSAEDIIALLLAECAAGGVTHWQPCSVKKVVFWASKAEDTSAGSYQIDTDRGTVQARSVVVATGGLSIPKIGATDFGYRLAQQFGIPLIERRPGLVPLTFDGDAWAPYAQLSGLALPVQISTGIQQGSHAPPLRGSLPPEGAAIALGRPGGKRKTRMAFDEDLLFTHRGLSGPAVLQISSYWQEGTPLSINLAPGVDLPDALAQAKLRSRKLLANELAQWVPSRLADAWAAQSSDWQRPVAEASDKALARLAEQLARWQLTPTGTEGYKKAEVTLGGIDTRALSQQTMECKAQPGLYFVGEVVDVTGWLGGYNFQWAWASAHACAQALPGA